MAKRLWWWIHPPLHVILLSVLAGSGLAAPAAPQAVPAEIESAATEFVACLQAVSEIPESGRLCGAAVAWHRKKLPVLSACLAERKIAEVSVDPKSNDGYQSARLTYSCRGGRLVSVRLINRGQGFAVDGLAELVID